jgi:hypothetical protein
VTSTDRLTRHSTFNAPYLPFWALSTTATSQNWLSPQQPFHDFCRTIVSSGNPLLLLTMRAPAPNPESSHRKLRIISVIAATTIALSCGTNYAYSAWAPQFAERLQLSATQQNLIGNFGNIGMYAMGIPGGILIDKYGPRYGVAAGVVALACGYFPMRSAYIAGPGKTSVTALCLFGLLTGVGSCTAFSAAIKVSATNWPRHRGTATAFPLSAFGLSAFFYTTVSAFAFPDDTSGYLLLLAVGTTCCVFVGMWFLSIVKSEGANGTYEAVPTDERPGGLARRDSNKMTRTHARNGGAANEAEIGKSMILHFHAHYCLS